MKLFRLAALAAVVSLAACTASPTESARSATASPSFDGDAGSQTVAGDTTNTSERGGNMLGSGN